MGKKKKEKEGEVYVDGGEKRKEKNKKRGNILRVHRRIEKERNRMRMDDILEVVKKIK